MSQQSFDAHAKILHEGQYEIRKIGVDVPINYFNEGYELEKSVQEKIRELNQEILDLEAQLREKRRMDQEQAERIIEQAQDEAKKVLEDAEQHAFDRVQKSVQEKESLIQKASEEAERLKLSAENESKEIKSQAERDAIKIKDIAKEDGFEQGHKQGLESGKKEVDFAVERLHGIIAETVRERERILVHSEEQVINLVLTMVSKIVKKLTVEHQQVVIENTKAALELLRGAMTLFVRVSPYDYNFTQNFKEELVRMIEAKAELKFIEDPTIEPGGVYIETDMGDVDATIRSQLEELETQMRFYMPVKVHKPEPKQESTQDNSIADKDVPKTPFAQREEYQSTVKMSTPESPVSESSVENTTEQTNTDEKNNNNNEESTAEVLTDAEETSTQEQAQEEIVVEVADTTVPSETPITQDKKDDSKDDSKNSANYSSPDIIA